MRHTVKKTVTNKLNHRWILVGFLLLLLSIVVAVAKAPANYLQQAEYLGRYLQSAGPIGVILMLALASLSISVGLPRQLFAFVFGFAYGIYAGFALAVIGAILGCALTYYAVRYLFARRFQNRFPEVQATLESWVKEDAFLKIVIVRFQPLGTNLITNICAGLIPLHAATFFSGSSIGFLPQSLVFSMLGAGLRVGSATQIWISLALLGVSLLLALVVFKRAS